MTSTSPQAAVSKALMVCFPPRLPSIFINYVLTTLSGAFFGTTFAHLFFQTYRELMPAPFWKQPSSSGSMSPSRSPRSVTGSNSSQQAPFVNPNPHGGQKRAAGKVYLPRIYGFKVSERAKSGPRMQWMRIRPESPEDLDEVDWRGRCHADDDDDDDDEEGEEEEETKTAGTRGSRHHGTAKTDDPIDQTLVHAMTTGSGFSARGSNSRGPAVGQLISV